MIHESTNRITLNEASRGASLANARNRTRARLNIRAQLRARDSPIDQATFRLSFARDRIIARQSYDARFQEFESSLYHRQPS